MSEMGTTEHPTVSHLYNETVLTSSGESDITEEAMASDLQDHGGCTWAVSRDDFNPSEEDSFTELSCRSSQSAVDDPEEYPSPLHSVTRSLLAEEWDEVEEGSSMKIARLGHAEDDNPPSEKMLDEEKGEVAVEGEGTAGEGASQSGRLGLGQ